MGNKLIKISPYKKEYQHSNTFSSFESSLAKHGYVRSPGTTENITPHREVDGRFRTGLDVKAAYIFDMSKDEQLVEIEKINEMLSRLKEVFPDDDFGVRSNVWKVYADPLPGQTVQATYVKGGNDDIILDTSDIQKLLTYTWLRVHPWVAPSMESIQRGGKYGRCKYYVVDDEAESRVTYSKKLAINKAISDFGALSPTRKRQVAILLGLPVSDDSKEEYIYNLVDDYIKKPDFKNGENFGRSTLNVLNEVMQLSSDVLEAKYLLEQAIRHNIYRMKGDIVMEGNSVKADSKASLISSLLKETEEYLALEIRVKNKQTLAK